MFRAITKLNLVTQIFIALILGIIVAFVFPQSASYVSILGELFIKALKSVAPILVFVLVISAITNYQPANNKQIRYIFILYAIGTLLAASSAVVASLLFPSELNLKHAYDAATQPPSDVGQVLKGLLISFIDNPVHALANANFIGVLAWAIGIGIAIRHASDTTKQVIRDFSNSIAFIISLVIKCAPIGIFGLVVVSIVEAGVDAIKNYLHVLLILLATMAFVALVINPFMVALVIRRNPYPLVLTCLKDSGITAFFTRSSAANIPVNLALADRMGVDKSLYSIAVPLGSSINMAGAAVTITILTMATIHTLGMQVDLFSMFLLCIVSALSACGVAGVAGGSLLLVPLACSLFGISSDIAMQVVTVGMVISILQDSTETALNSSTDVLFVIAADQAMKQKQGISISE
ncbi:serine/threonine transporter SstT [Acinetobacter qingfengensis]|uniref:Serine/threonine transporter SstT n=1 Tax=Acinetobacter qingfengensis TaxID=1262585 RepID=A0A1E7R5Q1_9GAMM|nr:serine/threonine transporter SstT [Acinetobacter qingfengensis]KAA8735591.1 serine/threonine transporter SstT [Acinetobacter qingfengensis]OEY94642.1 serine/threonine transporter SstT [Acinetobacter qingfengensis]